MRRSIPHNPKVVGSNPASATTFIKGNSPGTTGRIPFYRGLYEKYEFDFKNIETTKHKYSSIFNVFKVIFLGFKKILDYSFIKKLLLLGFLASGAFIMYAKSKTLEILNVKNSYFIKKNKNYLEIE